MKTEAEITDRLGRFKQKFERDEGRSALSSASIIMALEWVLGVEDKFIDLAHSEELLKPSEFHNS